MTADQSEPSVKRKDGAVLTLLLVDDEPEILSTMQRVLRNEPYKIVTAANGEEAQQRLAEQQVHILLTDLRMPKMGGEALLEYVAQTYPNIYRIVLTGYAELSSIKRAVNKGNIQCYLEKPWHKDSLVNALEAGRNQVLKYYSKRKQLKVVTSEKQALSERNEKLEKAVRDRTDMLRGSLRKLEQDKNAISQMLFNMVTACPHLDPKFALNVSDLGVKIAEQMELSQAEIDTIQLAGKLCEIGLVGFDRQLLDTPVSEYRFHKRQMYLSQVHFAEQILSPASSLDAVVKTVVQQFERVDGKGTPLQLAGDQIVVTAKILALARDVWLMAFGRMTGDKLSESVIKQFLYKKCNYWYDQAVFEAAMALPNLLSGYRTVTNTPLAALKPGMKLLSNLYSSNYLLIYPKGHVLTLQSIERLKRIEGNGGKLINMQAGNDVPVD